MVGARRLVTLRASLRTIAHGLGVVDLVQGVPDRQVVQADVAQSNGIAHRVNGVLLPLPL